VQRIGELLKLFLSRRLDREGERMAELVAAWPEAAGDAAAHVRVRDLRGGTIVVEADHPGWAQLVGMRKSTMLRRLRERFPDLGLEDIRVVAGARGPESAGTGRRPSKALGENPPPRPEGIEEQLGRVPDEGLRKSLRALYDEAEGDADSRKRGNDAGEKRNG
jgi:hypothetical protein